MVKYRFYILRILYNTLFIFVFISYAIPIYSNTNSVSDKPSYIAVKSFYGFIIPHAEVVRPISYTKPYGFSFDVGKVYFTNKAWNYCKCNPSLGLSFMYTNFDNPTVLGIAYSGLLYIELTKNIISKLFLSYRFGIGLSFLNNVYDSVQNSTNYFHSTHFSFPLHASVKLNFKLNKRHYIYLSGNYEHISNGGLKQPNYGINYPTLGIGLKYFLSDITPEYLKYEYSDIQYTKFTILDISLYGTAKIPYINEEKRYTIWGFSAEIGKKITLKNKLSAGIDYTVDYALQEIIKRNSADKDHKRLGLLFGHHFMVERITFYQKFGIYLYAPYAAYHPVYQRYGILYRFHNNFSVGFDLKAHRQIADFLDIRLVYHMYYK